MFRSKVSSEDSKDKKRTTEDSRRTSEYSDYRSSSVDDYEYSDDDSFDSSDDDYEYIRPKSTGTTEVEVKKKQVTYDVPALKYSPSEEEMFAKQMTEKPHKLKRVPTPTLLRRAKKKQPVRGQRSLRSRELSSSTSSLYIKNLITAPDWEEVVRCMTKALYWNIQENHLLDDKKLPEIFSERSHPLTSSLPATFKSPPSEHEVLKFIVWIFQTAQLSPETGVMSLAYIDRLALRGVFLHTTNWRRVLLGSLMLASKVWEELAVWNSDFIQAFPGMTVKDLNTMERCVLKALDFNVTLASSEYCKWYFELRDLAARDSRSFPLSKLDKKGIKKLEMKSKGLEEKLKKRDRLRLAKSFQSFTLKDSPHIVS